MECETADNPPYTEDHSTSARGLAIRGVLWNEVHDQVMEAAHTELEARAGRRVGRVDDPRAAHTPKGPRRHGQTERSSFSRGYQSGRGAAARLENREW